MISQFFQSKNINQNNLIFSKICQISFANIKQISSELIKSKEAEIKPLHRGSLFKLPCLSYCGEHMVRCK